MKLLQSGLSTLELGTAAVVGASGVCAAVLAYRRWAHAEAIVKYDEFGLFHENCEEFGLPWPPPVVRRESVALSDGRSLSMLKWGGEAPSKLVLLHGGAQNAHTWDTVALALGRPLLAIDLPSHGHSDGSSPGGAMDPTAAAKDVAAAIERHAPEAAAIVGMSFGGLTALALSALRPELVRKLVLVDITPGVTAEKASNIVKFVSGPTTFRSFDTLLTRTKLYNPTRSESSLRRGILHNAMQLEDGSWMWRHARFRQSDTAAGSLSHDDAMTGYAALWDALEALGPTTPCVLVRGLRSGSVVTDEDVAECRRRLPSIRVEAMAGSGHSVQGDQPVELASLLARVCDDN